MGVLYLLSFKLYKLYKNDSIRGTWGLHLNLEHIIASLRYLAAPTSKSYGWWLLTFSLIMLDYPMHILDLAVHLVHLSTWIGTVTHVILVIALSPNPSFFSFLGT